MQQEQHNRKKTQTEYTKKDTGTHYNMKFRVAEPHHFLEMHRIIRPFWMSGIRPDTGFDLPDILLDTEY
jgi:hypothetical protein